MQASLQLQRSLSRGGFVARITVEDCLEKVDNRFALVHVAAKRTKQLIKGARPLLTNVDNKPAVLALREIAAGLVKIGTQGKQSDEFEI